MGFQVRLSGKPRNERERLLSFGESFAGVLDGARGGQRWAWEAIYEDLAPSLLGYLRAQGASEPTDLTGEVFLQMVRDLRRFEGGESQFRGWTFAIAHNRLADQRRRLKSRPFELEGKKHIYHYQVGGNVEDEALSNIEEERVRQILASVPEDQRSVLLLRILADLTAGQVATVLGRTPGAVRAIERRGLAALKRKFSRLRVGAR